MRIFLTLLLSLLIFGVTKAQNETDNLDEDAITRKQGSDYNKDRLVLTLSYEHWLHDIPEFNTEWYNRGFGAYFMYDFQINESMFSVAPGIGVKTTNIYHNSDLVEDSSGISFSKIDDDLFENDYKQNKLQLAYFEAPFEFRWRSKNDKLDNQWKVAVGFLVGFRFHANTKQRINVGDHFKVYKTKNFPEFNKLKYGPTLRFGYAFANIYAHYSLSKVFKANQGPDVNAFTVGLSINGL